MITDAVRFDREWLSQLGLTYDPELMNFSTWRDRVHPDDADGSVELIRRHVSGLTATYENLHRLQHIDGSWRWILARGAIVHRDPAGRPLRFMGTHLDVTESERDRHQLVREHAQLARLITQMPIAVALLDVELRYLAVSDAWVRRYARGASDAGDLIGRPHEAVCPGEDPRWQTILRDALGGMASGADRDPFDAGGSRQWLRWEATPWVVEGRVEGVLVTREDLSRLVDAERRIVEQTRRSATNQLIAGLAHEINNPLEVIHLAAAVLGTVRSEDARIALATERITQATERISGLLGALGKLTREPAEEQPEPTRLGGLVERALDVSRARARRQGTQIVVDLGGLDDHEVLVIPAAVTHAILQLLDNALRALALQPHPVLRIEASALARFVELTVHDNGPGVPLAHQAMLFTPFAAADASRRGLGLAMAREQLSACHADLTHDAAALGARFVMRLPSHPAAPVVPPRPPSADRG